MSFRVEVDGHEALTGTGRVEFHGIKREGVGVRQK